jgi:hypothetical protein
LLHAEQSCKDRAEFCQDLETGGAVSEGLTSNPFQRASARVAQFELDTGTRNSGGGLVRRYDMRLNEQSILLCGSKLTARSAALTIRKVNRRTENLLYRDSKNFTITKRSINRCYNSVKDLSAALGPAGKPKRLPTSCESQKYTLQGAQRVKSYATRTKTTQAWPSWEVSLAASAQLALRGRCSFKSILRFPP